MLAACRVVRTSYDGTAAPGCLVWPIIRYLPTYVEVREGSREKEPTYVGCMKPQNEQKKRAEARSFAYNESNQTQGEHLCCLADVRT